VEQLDAVLPDDQLAVEGAGLPQKDLDMSPPLDGQIFDSLLERSAARFPSMRPFDREAVPPLEVQMHGTAGPIADIERPEGVVDRRPASRLELKNVPPVRRPIAARKVEPRAVVRFRMRAALVPAEEPDAGRAGRGNRDFGGVTTVVGDVLCRGRRRCAAVELAAALVEIPLRKIAGLMIGRP